MNNEKVLSIGWIKERLSVDQKTLWIYIVLYFSWGLGMHYFGAWAEIARFTYWWQVITVYLLHIVETSETLSK
ncbi:MAG: hypothetical protein AAFN10_21905 [Bacteroidota bacterium]